jgi:hypothetical protein
MKEPVWTLNQGLLPIDPVDANGAWSTGDRADRRVHGGRGGFPNLIWKRDLGNNLTDVPHRCICLAPDFSEDLLPLRNFLEHKARMLHEVGTKRHRLRSVDDLRHVAGKQHERSGRRQHNQNPNPTYSGPPMRTPHRRIHPREAIEPTDREAPYVPTRSKICPFVFQARLGHPPHAGSREFRAIPTRRRVRG